MLFIDLTGIPFVSFFEIWWQQRRSHGDNATSLDFKWLSPQMVRIDLIGSHSNSLLTSNNFSAETKETSLWACNWMAKSVESISMVLTSFQCWRLRPVAWELRRKSYRYELQLVESICDISLVTMSLICWCMAVSAHKLRIYIHGLWLRRDRVSMVQMPLLVGMFDGSSISVAEMVHVVHMIPLSHL